jgi:hypothetical protein
MDIANFHGLAPILMNSAGIAAPGGGSGAPSGAGEGSGGGEPTSTALVPAGDTGVEPSGGDGGAGGGGSGDGAVLVPGGGNFRAVEGGKITKATTEAFTHLTTTKPEYRGLANIAQKALLFRDRVLGLFPGKNPFDEIGALQRDLKALGGAKGIAAIRTELADVEENDALYASGDPKLLAKMTATPEAKSAFLKMVPHVMRLFEQIAPNQFSAHMARTFLGHMKTATINDQGDTFDVPLAIRRIQQGIAQASNLDMTKPESAHILQSALAVIAEEQKVLQAYIGVLQGYTQLQPEDLAPKPDAAVETERQRLQQETLNLQRERWRDARTAVMNSIYQAEWDKQTKGRELTPRQQMNIQAQFSTRLNVARRNLQDYRSTMDEFEAATDKDGFVQYHRNFFQEAIPRILAAEIKDEVGTATKKAPAAPNGQQQQSGAPSRSAPAAAGTFTRVNAWPNPSGADTKRGPNGTTTEMVGKRQGIASKNNQWGVKEGTLVSWAHLR